jgi:serine/threonine protein kinase
MLAVRTGTAGASKFVVLRPLAMGGMAEILLARVKDANPERLVVLKRLHRQLAADREHVQMFMDEARLATTLRHPNVVEVYEFGEDGDQYYIVMEYLHGHDLRRVLNEMVKQSISIRLSQALAIIAGVCRGLAYTHERTNAAGELIGIVHRDVSPHNVLLTYSGAVKLLDFGIAKASSHTSRTRTGILKGKVAYMSPEQAMGEDLDCRSDVFCIGILLWEMTTGQWLYRRKSELETLKAVVESDAPLPSLVLSGYPHKLETIVMKTLARKREDRWSSAADLADALTDFAGQQRIDLAPSRLRQMMLSVFSEDVAAWQDARRAGSTLGDHLVAELENEEREARKSPGDWPRGGPAPSGGGASSFGSRITVDDFDSPTVDHSPEDLQPPSDQRDPLVLEDEPTTVHMMQRVPLPLPPEAAPAPTPREPSQRRSQARRSLSSRRNRPTHMVPTLPPPDAAVGAAEPQALAQWLRVPRWVWVATSGLLALIALILVVITLLGRPSEPVPGKPVAPYARPTP